MTKPKKYLMTDIECLDVKSSAAIISIGAVLFDKNGLSNAKFYLPVDIQSSIDAGGTVSGSTLQFWTKQSNEAREVFQDKSAVPLKTALTGLKNYVYKTCSSYRNIHMVGNSARFDLGIIENAYHACDLEPFWNPFLERDYRTYKEMNEIDGKPKPKIVRASGGASASHEALQDAIEQAEHAIALNDYYGGIIL